MQKSLLLLFFLSLSISSLHSQGRITVKNGSLSSRNNFSTMKSYFSVYDGQTIILSPDTKGSLYTEESFQSGAILKDGKILFDNIQLKYNAYNDVFESKESPNIENKHAKTVLKSEEYQVKMGSKTYIAGPDLLNLNELQYYQIIMIGKKSHLVKKEFKTYKQGLRSPNGMTKDVPAIFRDHFEYYLVDLDKNYTKLPSSKKKIAQVFKGREQEIAKTIKKYKLDVNDEADLTRLVRYYNSL